MIWKRLLELLKKNKEENQILIEALALTKRQLKAFETRYIKAKGVTLTAQNNTFARTLEMQGITEDVYSSKEMAVIKVAESLNITVEPE